MSEPSLSVVIPTYNRRESLAVTLKGLSRQSYPATKFEVVVVSDGSTDGTQAMVEEFAISAIFNVRFVEQVNAGPSVARNTGVAASTNDVIVFLDDDVEPVATFLEHHASHHRDEEKCAVIGPMSPDPGMRTLEPAWIAWEHAKLQRLYAMFQPGGPYPSGRCGPAHFYSGNVSIARELLVRAGGFDVRYTRQEDVELACRLERNFGVTFQFDFNADGIHRPARTFDSWLKIPREYGRLDALRLADGSATYDDISTNFENRHVVSRRIQKIVKNDGPAAGVAIYLLKSLALLTSNLRQLRLSTLLLSGLYNAVYCRSFYAQQSLTSASAVGSDVAQRHTGETAQQ